MSLTQRNRALFRRILAAALTVVMLLGTPAFATETGSAGDGIVTPAPEPPTVPPKQEGTPPEQEVTPPEQEGTPPAEPAPSPPDSSVDESTGDGDANGFPPGTEAPLPADALLQKESLPIFPSQADPADVPEVGVYGNLVLDPFGRYTGYFEISLKVKTSATQAFRQAGATLKYNSDVLTPVDWLGNEIDLDGTGNYAVTLPTRKSDAVTAGTALIGGTNGYLYLNAGSDWGVTLADPAVTDVPVVVVRFKYDKANAPLKFDAANKKFLDAADAEVTLFEWLDETEPDCFTGSPGGQALWYESGDTSFYYVPAYDADSTKVENVTMNLGGTDYTYSAPATIGKRVAASAATGDPATDPNYISYMTNHMTGKVSVNAVSRESDDGKGSGITMNDVATLVFFDWDDSVLGATVVARGVDNRKTVNEFVLKNMVHPDLQANTNYSSMERVDTYRGEYPCVAPGNGATFPDDHATAPGKNYPLTNKLDYVFYKKVVTQNTDNTSPDFGKAEVTAPSDAAYPYTHGWQAVTPLTMADTWTALQANQVVLSADFTNITDGVTYVKALYEPGLLLNTGIGGGYYKNSDVAEYTRYTIATATKGDYGIMFKYYRVSEAGTGTARIKEPAVKMTITVDGAVDVIDVDSAVKVLGDAVEVTLTPNRKALKVSYQLVDKYNTSVTAGGPASFPDGLGVFINFKEGTQGDEGFVREGTLSHLLEEGTKSALNNVNNKWASMNNVAFTDCNLRATVTGTQFNAATVITSGRNRVLPAIKYALDNGYVNNRGYADYTVYQLQYWILNYNATTNPVPYLDKPTAEAYCRANYSWFQ